MSSIFYLLSVSIPSKQLLNRCVPISLMTFGTSLLQAASDSATDQVNGFSNYTISVCAASGNIIVRVMNDIVTTHMEVVYLSCGSVGLAFLLTILMRFFARVIIWLIILGMAFGSVGGAAFCWYTYFDYNEQLSKIPSDERTDSDEEYVRYWFYGAITVTGVAMVVLLLLLVMRKRIALVVQLFTEAGKAVAKMPMLLLQPLWTLIALAAFVGALGFGSMYLLSAGSPVKDSEGRVSYEDDKTLFYMKWYYLFGVLWVIQFVFASQMIIIAGAVATWYFTREKAELDVVQPKVPY